MEKVKGLRYDIKTGLMEEYEVEVEFSNPRIKEIEQRLSEIRVALAEGDWKTIKFMELGVESQEYITHKQERQALRDEYNSLEDELDTLE